jgi:phosphoribosyl 1,2-cyclic phosphodiesterase
VIELIVLGSSSSGNATLLRAGGQSLLIDAGFPAKELAARLSKAGVDLTEVQAVVVTHEHADHARGLGKLIHRARFRAAANEATAKALFHTFGIKGVHPLPEGAADQVGGFSVRALRVPHDSADCAGFEIAFEAFRMVYATDLGSVPVDLIDAGRRADLAVLEANHDERLLWAGSYPQFLKERIAGGRGHLSNARAGEAVAAMAGPRLRRVVLAHLSEENNRPETALKAIRHAIRKSAGLAGFNLEVEAAPKDGPFRVSMP